MTSVIAEIEQSGIYEEWVRDIRGFVERAKESLYIHDYVTVEPETSWHDFYTLVREVVELLEGKTP